MSVISDVLAKVKQVDPDQPEFHQAVEEVMEPWNRRRNVIRSS